MEDLSYQVFGRAPPQGAEQIVTESRTPRRNELVKQSLRLEEGFIVIPDEPGIGVELIEDVEKRFPYKPRRVATRLHRDGSVSWINKRVPRAKTK